MPKSKPAGWENIVGLLLIMGGLITYRFWPALQSWWRGKEEENEASA